FEPVLNGRFLRVLMARFDPAAPAGVITTDLNPHLEPYAGSSVPQAVRDQSLGDPRAIVWNGAGTAGYVAGMGSNTVVRIDAAGARLGQIEAGEGPTGLALDETRGRLYVLDKFAGRVTVVETAGHSVIAARNFFDPTPQVIRLGRPHLYDTRRTSGLGHVSCASCHIDARMDQLAWDLGNPAGAVQPFDQNCNFGVGGCENWHPMKGPMVTQSLQGLPGTGPLHWRADRANLAAFNGAFVGLLGDDVMLTPQEMAQFNSFLATIIYPPNPFRTITNALPTTPINGGNAVTGDQLYRNAPIDGGFLTCNACHALPTGTNGTVTSANLLGETQSMKIPQLRNMYEKTGLDLIPGSVNNRGFGYIHDGSSPNLVAFLQAPVFNFPPGPTGMQQRRDIAAFVFAMSVDTHAGVGTQNTVATGSLSLLPPDQQARLNTMVSLAQGGSAGLVAKGRVAGRGRGYVYDQAASGFRSDRTGEPVLSLIQLAALTGPGSELTFTTVPIGTQRRIGIDRDADTWLDGDERAVCADPADPAVFPGSPRSVDRNADLLVGTSDVSVFLTSWFADLSTGTFTSDFDASGTVSTADITAFLGAWFAALAGGC
ncbi:MAG TPA: hypothetical protein VD963_03345, partial [Phycisphaerales bacterium]|nr:hypothetical protein [Phycisphaerales bacterium]